MLQQDINCILSCHGNHEGALQISREPHVEHNRATTWVEPGCLHPYMEGCLSNICTGLCLSENKPQMCESTESSEFICYSSYHSLNWHRALQLELGNLNNKWRLRLGWTMKDGFGIRGPKSKPLQPHFKLCGSFKLILVCSNVIWRWW